jgi:hypothetical protein
MLTTSTRRREIQFEHRRCTSVPRKQADEILLLAGNNDAVKSFDWMRAHTVRSCP